MGYGNRHANERMDTSDIEENLGHKHGHRHKVVPGLIDEKDLCKLREAVCIQVEKIYDSCREKDCIEDAPVLFLRNDARNLIHRAINVKARCADVVDVYADTEPVPFKRGFYTVDVKFFIKVTLEFFVPEMGTGRIITVTRDGLVTFDKKVILFGSEGTVKIFKSHFRECAADTPIRSRLQQDNLPISKVEVAEPIALNARIEEGIERSSDECSDRDRIPNNLLAELTSADDVKCKDKDNTSDISGRGNHHRRVVVSIGLFSIIKLVRFVQLLIPAFDFCYPIKECIASTEENPCELFDTIEFPFDEFYPPQKFDFPGAMEAEREMWSEDHHHKGREEG